VLLLALVPRLVEAATSVPAMGWLSQVERYLPGPVTVTVVNRKVEPSEREGKRKEAAIQARIMNRTCRSTKREEIRADQFRVGLHLSEDPRQGAHQLCFGREVPIVGPVFPSVLPEPLDRVKLGRVRR